MTEKNEKRIIEVPRRQFIAGVGKFAAGAAVGMGALGLVGCSSTETAQAEGENTSAEGGASKVELPAWPWPYKKLDVEKVRKAGYDYYHAGLHCMGGAFKAIIGTLAEEVGFPYNALPIDTMAFYGQGGVMGWATLCGAANGASMAINLVLGNKHEKLGAAINEVMGYYSTEPMPTAASNKFGDMGELAQSVAGNPLCHASVTNWCKASGYKSFSKERAERCGRITGDTAARAAEILNEIADNGNFTAAYKAPDTIATCAACHDKGGTLENTRGKMDCITCHEPHEL